MVVPKKEEKAPKEVLEDTPIKEEVQRDVESGEIALENEPLESEDLKAVKEKLEIAALGESVKPQAQSHAQDLKTLDDEKKIKKLLELAKTKGVAYAIGVAKKLDDPYVLDILHDTLAKEGYYKSFLKKT